MAADYDVKGNPIKKKTVGFTNPFAEPKQPAFNPADPAGSFAAQSEYVAGADARLASARQTEYEAKYGQTTADWEQATSQTMLDELALAKRQAAGKLGFALSSGPGTSGLSVAAQNALDRQFSTQRALSLNRVNEASAQFRLNWDLQQDKFDYGFEMSKLQFKQQQMLLQQQAELNSASWWEQLGGIIGFGIGAYMNPIGTAVSAFSNIGGTATNPTVTGRGPI